MEPPVESGPRFCPRIIAMDSGNEILVAAGAKKSTRVKVHIMQKFIVQCQFNIEGRVTSLNARLLGDTIYCDAMNFEYTSKSPNLTAKFDVIWGQTKLLDNPENVHGNLHTILDAHRT